MTEFLIYDLKVAVLIAAFYFCYRLLMERETMHRLNRIVLLSSILLSLLLPLCVITLHKTIEVEQIPVIDTAELVITELGESEGQVHDWVKDRHHATSPLDSSSIIFAIFIIGVACRLLYIANSYRHLRRFTPNDQG